MSDFSILWTTLSFFCWKHILRSSCVCYAPTQWEMVRHCNSVSHWLGAYTEWSLIYGVWLLMNYSILCLLMMTIRCTPSAGTVPMIILRIFDQTCYGYDITLSYEYHIQQLVSTNFIDTIKICITGLLWGELTSYQWIPLTRGQIYGNLFHAMFDFLNKVLD